MIEIIIKNKNPFMVIDIILKKEFVYDDRYHQKKQEFFYDDIYHHQRILVKRRREKYVHSTTSRRH